MPNIGSSLKKTWNAFISRLPTRTTWEIPEDVTEYKFYPPQQTIYGSASRPDRMHFTRANAKSIVTYIYNRIAVDCAQINIRHVRLDEFEGRYKETLNTSLNYCLSHSANIDQTGRAFIQDAVMSMFDEGCVALVPTDTDGEDPRYGDSYKVEAVRTGRIKEWYPTQVRVEVYNDLTGKKEEVLLPKKCVAIIENPFYATMNESNSTAQRLIRVLNQLDRTNEQNSAGKLDLIIQLPYVVRNDAKREQAEQRRRDIEAQLTGSQYGIAYTDGTERITQLNRAVENNLWTQAKDLLADLYNQLGLTEAIFNGTADEQTMLNYYNHTIEPILSAITEEMERKWLSQTARTQLQAIRFFRDPFKLVPVNDLAEIADKFTRNEIMTSNEIRSVIGLKPSDDPRANELINSNLNHSDQELGVTEQDDANAEATGDSEPQGDEYEDVDY